MKLSSLFVCLSAVLTAVFLFEGCSSAPGSSGPATGSPTQAPAPASPNDFKVALITPGNIDDGGWSQNAYEGLKKTEKELGASVANSVAGSPAEAFSDFRNYADKGTNLIIGHASEWFDPKLQEIAAAHPKTTILISGQNAKDNIIGVRFVLEDGCYVLGQLAALMSKSKVLGCVGPEEIPVISSTFQAFEAGAKSVDKNIKVNVVWTKDSKDIARAKEITLNLLNQGADFVFHNANDAAAGVFQAVQEKNKQGGSVFAFGSNGDQSRMAEDVILASAILDIPSAFLNIAKTVKDGKVVPGVQYLGIPEGAVGVAYNKKLEGKIPVEVRKQVDETIEKIKKQELKVPRLELK